VALPNICPIIEAPLLRLAALQPVSPPSVEDDAVPEGGVIERRKEPNWADAGSEAATAAMMQMKQSDLTSPNPYPAASSRAMDGCASIITSP
jgi:hypothetical protein